MSLNWEKYGKSSADLLIYRTKLNFTRISESYYPYFLYFMNVKLHSGSKEIPKDNEYEKAVVACNVVYAVDTTTEPATLKKISELSGRTPKIAMLDSNQVFYPPVLPEYFCFRIRYGMVTIRFIIAYFYNS